MSRSLCKIWWYNLAHVFVRTVGRLYFGLRSAGQENIPATGPVLLIANHQSNGDPLLIGCCISRRLNFVARETLFQIPVLGWLIRSFDGFPIDREGMGLAGIKETMKRLKAQEMVLIFPEGTRTSDGTVQPLKPGFLALVRRTKAAIVPVGLAGLYEAWPRGKSLPRMGQVRVQFGPAIRAAEYESLNDEELLALVTGRLGEAFQQATAARIAK